MGQDFFIHLPSEITIDILSRLPIRSAVRCKCVGKSWRNLIETPEFVKSYKSFPSFANFQGKEIPNPYKIYELEDVFNIHENNSNNRYSCKEAFNFDFPHPIPIHSSADGLLFLCHNYEWRCNHLIVCNPVTREYINIPNPQADMNIKWNKVGSFGFGVSKTSGQYKLVRVSHELKSSYGQLACDGPHCQVHTLGTGSWRSINVPSNIRFVSDIDSLRGAFLNGNYHWLAYSERDQWIFCLDLESELFTTLSLPPHLDVRPNSQYRRSLSALREDSLCLCDTEPDSSVDVWLMKEYGDDKSWTKQYVIPKIETLSWLQSFVRVIKVLNNDDVLLTKRDYPETFCYSNEKRTFKKIESIASAVCYTPSFLQLKTLFLKGNICSF